MATVIRDPVTQDAALVTADNRLQVESESSQREFFISKNAGQVFHVLSEDAAVGANEEILYIQNTSPTKLLFLGNLIVTSDINIKFRIKKVTGTAAGGSVLLAENLNLTSANAADANIRGNGSVTGLTDDGDIFVCRSLAGGSRLVNFGDTVILGQNNAIAVEIETGSSAVEMTLDFHFE